MENGMKLTAQYDRIYRFVKLPALPPKGMQRIIVLNIIRSSHEPMAVREVARLAALAGLTATAGVTASVAWHLHQMAKSGEVALVNQFTPVATQPDTTGFTGFAQVEMK